MNCSVVTHHNSAWWRSQRATSRCTAGNSFRRGSRRGGKRVPGAAWTPLGPSVLHLQPDQEAVSQHHAHPMAVKALPESSLVLVPAQLSLGLLLELLNGMAAMGILCQFLQGSRSWQIAPVVLGVPLPPSGRSLPKQPALSSPIPGALPAVEGDELLSEPALAPLPPTDGAPQAAGQGSQHLVGPTSRRLGRQAHSKVGSDSYHIGFPTLLQSGQEVGIVAVVCCIGYHTVVGHSPTPGLVQQG